MKTFPMLLVIVSTCLGAGSALASVEPSTFLNKAESVIEVTGSYRPASGDTTKWLPMSLKLRVKKTADGEIYEVTASRVPLDYGWMSHYIGSVARKVDGPLSDTYSHSVTVRGHTVYFNLC